MEFTTRPASDDGSAPATDTANATAVDTETSASDTLSPAVRRLIRQYDLDVTTIQGTGPSGRIRVGDVIGMLGGRASEAPPLKPVDRPPAATTFSGVETLAEENNDDEQDRTAAPAAEPAAAHAAITVPTTTVFDCDLSRVLAHRKRLRAQNLDVLLTSYFLVALAEASRTVAEITAGAAPVFDVRLTAADGNVHLLRATANDAATADEQLRRVDAELRGAASGATAPNLLVHHYGASGSLLATPTPIGADHAGSIGIGRVRREIVVRTNDAGEEAPRVTALCNLSLSFYTDRLAFDRANLLLATAVRFLEAWPD